MQIYTDLWKSNFRYWSEIRINKDLCRSMRIDSVQYSIHHLICLNKMKHPSSYHTTCLFWRDVQNIYNVIHQSLIFCIWCIEANCFSFLKDLHTMMDFCNQFPVKINVHYRRSAALFFLELFIHNMVWKLELLLKTSTLPIGQCWIYWVVYMWGHGGGGGLLFLHLLMYPRSANPATLSSE